MTEAQKPNFQTFEEIVVPAINQADQEANTERAEILRELEEIKRRHTQKAIKARECALEGKCSPEDELEKSLKDIK